jgi:hypothetical protein
MNSPPIDKAPGIDIPEIKRDLSVAALAPTPKN